MKKAVGILGFLVLMLALTYFALGEYRNIKNRGATEPPPAGQTLPVDKNARQKIKTLLGDTKGFVVWSSNRSGNHEIYAMSLPDLEIKPLTHNPHVDYYPRISPDGSKVVFARSQIPWVSQRDNEHWDVYVLDLVSGAETLLARDANAPMWFDAGSVIFQRRDSRVVKKNIDGSGEQVLFESGPKQIPKDVRLETPDIDAKSGAMVVTFRGAVRMTALVSADGNIRKVAGGCQINWSPDKSFLYYVDHGGRMKNQFYKIDLQTLSQTKWLDLPGEYSHEYFPRLSQDERWLVFGASAKGHEHDTADYEIFLWKVGTSPEGAVRLTYHTGNDCWPDIYVE